MSLPIIVKNTWTMATTIEQQVALDEALVPSTQDVPEIYMQELWATTYVHQHSIRFKLDNKKHIVNLETFRDMLHIRPRIPGQSFDELPFEEEILEFLWNIDYAFLIWEDFVYQVKHKNHKKINEMYYPRFTKVIIHHFMSKDLSIPRRNKVNWHYVRDDIIFSTIEVVSRHRNTQQYATPKPKASARRKRSGSDTSITPPTAITTPTTTVTITLRLTAAAKGKQPAKAKSPSDPLEEIAKIDEQDDTKRGGDDEESDDEETREDESFDPIPRTTEDSEDDGNGKEDQGLGISEEERLNEEEEADELYRDVDINQGRGLQLSQDMEDTYVTLTLVNPDCQQESLSVSSQFVTNMLNPTSDVGMESIFTTASSLVAPLQTSTPIMTPSTIATITTVSQAPIPPTPIPSEVLQNLPTFDSMFHFDERLKSLEASLSEYKQTNPFAEAVSNIPSIVHQYMNHQMNEAVRVAVQIQTDQHHDSYQREDDEFLRTIDDNIKRIIKEQVKTDLLKMELKKILIEEKMEGNKSIQHSDEQRNLYKALVEAYEADKIILDTYGERVILKRRRDDDVDQGEGPFAGSDWGSKRQRKGKEPESASAPLEPATRNGGRSTTGSKSRQASASESAFTKELVQTTSQIEDPSHLVFETGAEDQPIELINYDKHAFWGVSHWGRKRQQFYGFAVNQEFALDVYSKRRIIAVTDLKIVEWHSYKHLDWITIRRDNDKLYNFKEGDFKRLRLQDIEDMLLLLVQGKLSNLTVEERFAFNVSLRMFTRSIAIQRRVEDLQLGVEIYQKRLNLTKLDTYRFDLKHREAYTAYSNPRGFIYQNKDKKNRLMRIDELHKFSDEMLNDVRNALEDHLKGIRIQYLPQTIWRKGDKDREASMIQAIEKMLKTRRIMRSLERFVGGRLYEGDFQMLQRTI
uniref:Uncharacterized protein n=1 Tax=Tanacetum cinerariifolium TaxID=118510 RepID=A0A6L2KNC2_TANCI|nr:hypothetical protein [Tanacetum cinerariifolium]